MSIFEELKRRSVIRTAALYVVVSWLLLQVADILFDAFDVPSWSIRLLIAILVLGFPLAVVFSWVFELTPDGLRRETQGETGRGTQAAAGKTNIAIGVSLLLAVVFVVADRMIPEKPIMAVADRSIAVLPFANISDDPANDYFSEGLSEELLNLLAGIPELMVTARTSSFSFKDKNLDVPTIGNLLNVAHILEGSVRKSDTHLRITAQLINVESGFHIWSQTYDREMDDIFAIQDEISEAVVAALRVSILGEAPRARETDPEAFTAYLNALHFYQQRTSESYKKAADYSQRAVDIDPNYAPAWNLLGATLSNQALSNQYPYDETHRKALVAVERALEIDPEYAFAISARAWLAMNYERDYATAAALFRHAVDLEPDNAVILGNRAILANRLDLVDEALRLLKRSIVLNPVTTVGYSNLSDMLARAGRPIDAIKAAQKAIELAPGNLIARVNLAAAYLLAEQTEKALEEVETVDWRFAQLLIRSLAYHTLGQTAQSDEALSQLADEFGGTNAFSIAMVYSWRNEVDSAFEWLDRAVDERQPTNGIRNEPFLKNARDDARWNPLLLRVGLSDEQVAAIIF